MRKLLILSGIMLSLITNESIAQETKSSCIVDIKDVRKKKEPKPDLTKHRDREVEVYRVRSKERVGGKKYKWTGYQVYFYRRENDTLRMYQAGNNSKDDLDKAEYKWIDDTLASIRLYSSQIKKEVTFEVFGHHNANGSKTTGMIIDR